MDLDGYFLYKKGRTTPETLSLVLGSLTLCIYYNIYYNNCQHLF
nr:MAG TPA: Lecithin retinol acyltransferase [Herelleviridae sp.]